MFDIVLRLVIAGAIGVLIGWINISRAQVVRFFALISMGSALATIISTGFLTSAHIHLAADPGRISAQILSALGFLGLGLIWIGSDRRIHGLSIMANMWVASVIGILIGMDLNSGNVAVVATILFILVLLNIRAIYQIRFKEKMANDK